MSCDRVALSRFSVQLGLPVAVWGGIGYALMAGLAASGMARRSLYSSWPAGLLLLGSGAAAAVSIALALVSKLALGAWCPLCMVSWVISFALLATAWRSCRCMGAGRAIRADIAALRTRPFRTAAVLFLLVAGVALTASVYPRYWERRPASALTPPSPVRLESEEQPPDTNRLLVFGYTDYECPACGRMHQEPRDLARRPDVKLVRRHFPLDPTCNPAVKSLTHPSACALARAGICAEAQAKLGEMEDALFANQRERAPLETLAARVGLDLDRFRACLVSPETDRRLAADVAAAMRDGVRATPSFVVGGIVHAGRLPAELVGPPRARQGG